MNKLTRDYNFKTFLEAMKFVNKVADLAEAEDHHPDISIKYNRVQLTFYTHTTNSVTEKDKQLADKIERLLN